MDVRGAMMDSVGNKFNLDDQGTRFDHYMELKEVFMLGIDVIDRMNSSFVSDADRVTKIKLQNAVEVINKRLDYLSDFTEKTHYYGDLAREVNAAGIHRTPLLAGGSDEPQVKHQPSDSKNSSDTTNLG